MKFQVIQTQTELSKQSFKSVKLLPAANGKYAVHVELTPSAATQLQQFTANNIDHVINIVWNKQVLSTVEIKSALGGSLDIAGLSLKEATLRKKH